MSRRFLAAAFLSALLLVPTESDAAGPAAKKTPIAKDAKSPAKPAKPAAKNAPAKGKTPKGAGAPTNKQAPPLGTIERSKVSVAPQASKAATFNHAPFEMGECGLCHKTNDPKKPGPLKAAVNDICGECHDDLMAASYKHKAATIACTNCHNPHNAERTKLLVKEVRDLCLTCHLQINKVVTEAKVQHGALTEGRACLNCHNPHAAAVENLLLAVPIDLCMSCHGKDDVVDGDGKKLTNLKALLEANPVHHAPVEAGDCSACHRPHGSANFRLLDSYYPEKFYAPWSRDSYAICFQCHQESAFEEARTTTMTQFRDGAKNLHFVHVNKQMRGRTCRACHEVHAAKQEGNIRDGVPYGSKGWTLTLNYTRTETGGFCQKTCHEKRAYKNSSNPSKTKATRPDYKFSPNKRPAAPSKLKDG